MPTVLIARHGETTWNVSGRYQGRLESELSSRGLAQAQALAEAAGGYDLGRILSSPLKRCVSTAQAVADRLALSVEVDLRLIEIAHGTWEGRYRDELAANDSERYRCWRGSPESVAFEKGESLADVLARWSDFARDFNPAANTLLVTHDAVVRVAILERTGRPLADFWRPRVLNGCFAVFNVFGGNWVLREECIAGHLRGLTADISAQAL